MPKLKPKWKGTINVDGVARVSGSAYSATIKPPRLIVPVHRRCLGRVQERKRGVARPAKHGLVCTECEKAVRANSVGQAALNEQGKLVLLTTPELAALRPTPITTVRTILAYQNDRNIAALGTERRMYFLPEEDDANFAAYREVWYYLYMHEQVGYIDELVIASDNASYHAILRALNFPPEFNNGKREDVLVLECLVDPATIRAPGTCGEFPSFRKVPAKIRKRSLRGLAIEAASLLTPKAIRLARIISAKTR